MKKFKYVFLVILGLIFLTGCNPIIVGDSIADMSRNEILTRMPNALVDASPGRGAYNTGIGGQPRTGLEAVKHNIQFTNPGEWMVVELGSNNLTFTQNQKIWFVAEVVNAVPNDRCLAWVVPYHTYFGSDFGWYSAIMSYLPQNQPCHAVIRWDQLLAQDPSLVYDWVHPTPAGKVALADLIASGTGF